MNTICAAILSIFLLTGIDVFSQTKRQYETNPDRKRTYNWLFGNQVWLDFNTNPPQIKSGSQLNALEAASAYSDTSGNLLFYSNGLTVWNRNHNVILNGTGLNGDNSSSQGVLFIRHPAIDSIVYLFTTDDQCGPKGLQVSKISIHPEIDSSIIIDKNRVLVTPVCESISAIQHQNGRYTWVTVHSKSGNTFYSFLISDAGISECPVTSNQGLSYDGDIFNCQTTSRFSSNGKHYAINMLNDFKVMLFAFNNSNGLLTYIRKFDNMIIPTGITFSNNDSFLYTIERSKQINQIKISNGQNNIVKLINNAFNIIQIEKTPINNLLVNVLDSFYTANILYPDSIGSKANFIQRYLYLNGVKGKNGLCNFNQSYFYTPSIDFAYSYDCITNSISFEGRDTFYADSFNWKARMVFGSTSYSSSKKNPKITFTDTGLYEITFIATKGNRSDTVIKRITIYPRIDGDFLGRDTMYRSDVPFSLVLKTPPDMHCIRWNDSSSSPTFTADTTGIYIATITNKAFCTVSDTIIVTRCENSLPKPVLWRDNDTLKTHFSIADSFIWYRNGNQVSITKDTFILLNDTGTFMVTASKQGHCDNAGDVFNYPCIPGLAIPTIHLQKVTIIANHSEADSFVWYRNGQVYLSGTDSFILPDDTGTFRVEAYLDKYCHTTSKGIHVTCLDKMTTPGIRLSRDTLYATGTQADSFAWYRNGQKIKITKEEFIKLSDTGTYRVEAIRNRYCSKISESLLINKFDVGFKRLSSGNIGIYPNPADETLTIVTLVENGFIIRLYDSEGRLVLENTSEGSVTTLNVVEFTQGLYHLELNNYQTTYHYKILIQ